VRIITDIEEDIRLIKKYSEGADADEVDCDTLSHLARIGYMKKGVSVRRFVITAKSTILGLELIFK